MNIVVTFPPDDTKAKWKGYLCHPNTETRRREGSGERIEVDGFLLQQYQLTQIHLFN